MLFEDRVINVSVDGISFPAEVRSMDIETSSIILSIEFPHGREHAILFTDLSEESPKETIWYNERLYTSVINGKTFEAIFDPKLGRETVVITKRS